MNAGRLSKTNQIRTRSELKRRSLIPFCADQKGRRSRPTASFFAGSESLAPTKCVRDSANAWGRFHGSSSRERTSYRIGVLRRKRRRFHEKATLRAARSLRIFRSTRV